MHFSLLFILTWNKSLYCITIIFFQPIQYVITCLLICSLYLSCAFDLHVYDPWICNKSTLAFDLSRSASLNSKLHTSFFHACTTKPLNASLYLISHLSLTHTHTHFAKSPSLGNLQCHWWMATPTNKIIKARNSHKI